MPVPFQYRLQGTRDPVSVPESDIRAWDSVSGIGNMTSYPYPEPGLGPGTRYRYPEPDIGFRATISGCDTGYRVPILGSGFRVPITCPGPDTSFRVLIPGLGYHKLLQ